MISSLLGATAKNIHKIFEYAKRQPCVLFLDEFDAIAKARDDQHELGELKRVVNSLLHNIGDYCDDGILIAATNPRSYWIMPYGEDFKLSLRCRALAYLK